MTSWQASSRGAEDRAHSYKFYVAVGDDRWTGCVGKHFEIGTTLTAIRSSMNEERSEALLLLQVHREDTRSVDAVLDHFASTSARLKFVL